MALSVHYLGLEVHWTGN